MNLPLLLTLFWSFFKVGLFSFGGGYAMIPLMESEIITRYSWLSPSEFIDIIAIAETTPGPIAINSATYVGYQIAGLTGSAAATIGVVAPSLLILLALGTFLVKAVQHPRIEPALRGLRPAIIALILLAAISLGKTALVDRATVAIAALLFLLAIRFRANPFYLIIAGAILGLIFYPR
ncbi:MAG: chromate transporter [Firmicutes bacterium]|nr:chromate transporter [Bacillota bacterium]